jgi:lipopolysaccharide biosynthesis glycosyltransferase
MANDNECVPISPYFKNNNIPIVFACDNNYAPFLGVCIKSLLANADANRNYDIIVLQTKIEDTNQTLLCLIVNEYKNASIRFVDVSKLIENIKLPTHNYFTKETYYRLFAPKIFENYSKIIYLDSDIIVIYDISKLYDVDIDGYLIAATRDFGMIKQYLDNRRYRNHNVVEYFHKKLLLDKDDSLNYSQAGVLLMNIEEMMKTAFMQSAIKLVRQQTYILVDQDILNTICRKRIKRISQRWDFIAVFSLVDKAKSLPLEYDYEYCDSRDNSYIIHYADLMLKPWVVPYNDISHIWWHYARQTPFYEIILSGMLPFKIVLFEIVKYIKWQNKSWISRKLASTIKKGEQKERSHIIQLLLSGVRDVLRRR